MLQWHFVPAGDSVSFISHVMHSDNSATIHPIFFSKHQDLTFMFRANVTFKATLVYRHWDFIDVAKIRRPDEHRGRVLRIQYVDRQGGRWRHELLLAVKITTTVLERKGLTVLIHISKPDLMRKQLFHWPHLAFQEMHPKIYFEICPFWCHKWHWKFTDASTWIITKLPGKVFLWPHKQQFTH